MVGWRSQGGNKSKKGGMQDSQEKKKLYEQCPNEASGNEVQDLWRDYQEKKRIAKELVRKRRGRKEKLF